MDIFRHRPLFLCCSVFLLATLAGLFLRSAGILMAVGGVLGGGRVCTVYSQVML